MAAIPTIEKTENAKCQICSGNCSKLCSLCGTNFCNKHLLYHSEKCSGYKGIIKSILLDDLMDISKGVMEAILRSI